MNVDTPAPFEWINNKAYSVCVFKSICQIDEKKVKDLVEPKKMDPPYPQKSAKIRLAADEMLMTCTGIFKE